MKARRIDTSPLKPRQKIFFSADIVGSTAYKQAFTMDATEGGLIDQSAKLRKKWYDVITTFYRSMAEDFPRIWEAKLAELAPEDDVIFREMVGGAGPVPWKTIGDEFIFWKELGHEWQIWIALAAWMESLALQRKRLKRDDLDIKSSIWLAEFPVRNTAVVLKIDAKEEPYEQLRTSIIDPLFKIRGDFGGTLTSPLTRPGLAEFYRSPYRSGNKVDFIGPGIDVGFRISKFSSLRRMVLSVDVVYMLCLSHLALIRYGSNSIQKEELEVRLRDRKTGKTHEIPRNILTRYGLLSEMLNKLKIIDDFQISPKGNSISIRNIDVHYSGAEELKGVLGGIKYPIFWINVAAADSFESAKELLYLPDTGRSTTNWIKFFDFCQNFYWERRRYIRKPVILRYPKPRDNVKNDNWSFSWTLKVFRDYAAAYRTVVGSPLPDEK